MAGTVIKKCTCEHEYQDKKYGRKKRVFNLGLKGTGYYPAKCTVCGKKITVSSGDVVTH